MSRKMGSLDSSVFFPLLFMELAFPFLNKKKRNINTADLLTAVS